MAESRAIQNGTIFLSKRRPVILGISPGNPHFYKLENLRRLFDFGKENSEEVFLFIPDKISEHNYRAVGSKNPEKSARLKANRLRNKCEEAIKEFSLHASHRYIKWTDEVETSKKYEDALRNIKNLYQLNDDFCADVRHLTDAALNCMKDGREKASKKEGGKEVVIDIEEGVNYLLKELAFFEALPDIYKGWEEFVIVYHRPWPVLEKFLNGAYDGILRPCLGIVILE